MKRPVRSGRRSGRVVAAGLAVLATACGSGGTGTVAHQPVTTGSRADTTASSGLPLPTVPPTSVVAAGAAPATPATTTAPPSTVVPSTSTVTVPGPGSGVDGVVLFSPVCPVERFPPEPGCAPRPGPAEVRLVRADGTVAGTARARDDGQFTIAVPPGRYGVEASVPGPGIGGGCAADPTQVSVGEGTFSTVRVSCDTGIR